MSPKLLFSGALLVGLGLLLKSTTKRNPNPNPDASASTSTNPNVDAKGKRPLLASSKTIRLKSSDGQTFEVEELVALESLTIKNMIEDGCADSVIPLPNVKGQILSMIIDYCRKHVYSPKSDNATVNLIAADELRIWDAKFVNVRNSILLDLILAANYLNVKSLLDLTCQTVANMIMGKTPEELRKTFNLKNDFSPEELEEVRRENIWAFE